MIILQALTILGRATPIFPSPSSTGSVRAAPVVLGELLRILLERFLVSFLFADARHLVEFARGGAVVPSRATNVCCTRQTANMMLLHGHVDLTNALANATDYPMARERRKPQAARALMASRLHHILNRYREGSLSRQACLILVNPHRIHT